MQPRDRFQLPRIKEPPWSWSHAQEVQVGGRRQQRANVAVAFFTESPILGRRSTPLSPGVDRLSMGGQKKGRLCDGFDHGPVHAASGLTNRWECSAERADIEACLFPEAMKHLLHRTRYAASRVGSSLRALPNTGKCLADLGRSFANSIILRWRGHRYIYRLVPLQNPRISPTSPCCSH